DGDECNVRRGPRKVSLMVAIWPNKANEGKCRNYKDACVVGWVEFFTRPNIWDTDRGCWVSQARPNLLSLLRRRALDDVAAVRRERGGGGDALQRLLGPRAADGLEHAPALHRREQPRRELRILRVEHQHGVRDELVAGAVGAVELFLVRHRKSADQRAHAVGI